MMVEICGQLFYVSGELLAVFTRRVGSFNSIAIIRRDEEGILRSVVYTDFGDGEFRLNFESFATNPGTDFNKKTYSDWQEVTL